MMRKCIAYSLIELLVVLALISLLATISAGGFKHFFLKTEAQIVADKLFSAFSMAKQIARHQHAQLVLCPSKYLKHCDEQWGQHIVLFEEIDPTNMILNAKNIISVFDLNADRGKLQWRSFPKRSYLVFSPTFSDTTNNGSFWYCLPNQKNPSWALVINRGHRERMVYPDKHNLIFDNKGQRLTCD